MKRQWFLILLAVMLLAGCGKANGKAVTAQAFAETAEKLGAVTQTLRTGDVYSSDYPEALIARVLFDNDASGWSGEFWEFDSERAALACIHRLQGTDGSSDGSDRFEITLSEGAQPVLEAMRVQNTVLLVSCQNNAGSKDAVEKLLKALHYV